MGSKTNHKSYSAKARSSTSKKNISAKRAAKKGHHKWSKDRSERVRDDLNHDVDFLYNALENSPGPSLVPQTDSVISLADRMQGLGS